MYRLKIGADPKIDELEQLARTALPLLEQADNHAGLVHIWGALGEAANTRGRYEDRANATEQALRHARLAGQRNSYLFNLETALAQGPRPADEALRTLDALLPENPHPFSLMMRAWLLTMLARFDEADKLAREAGEHWRELRGDDAVDWVFGTIEASAGRHEDAAAHLRRYCDMLETLGQRNYLSTYAPMLGRSFCKLGRHDEAEPLAQLGHELGAPDDVLTQMLWRQVQALVDSYRGQHSHAEQLARTAVAISEQTDALNVQGDALSDLAEVLHTAGRTDEAAAALDQALDRYECKHNLAQAAQVRDRLLELHGAAPL